MPLTIRILVLLATASFAASSGAVERHEYREIIMGVETKIILYSPDEETARRAARRAFDSVIELDAVLSDYRNDSEAMRLCRSAANKPVEVSEDLFAILRESEQLSRISEGAFDVSIGPLSRLWREARRTGEAPTPEALRDARRRTGWRKIMLAESTRSVTLLDADMRVDFGAIGKGYAADRAVEVLTALGHPQCLVSIGGDVAAGAAPPNIAGWQVEVRMSGDEAGNTGLTLAHRAVATSGDTEQFVEIDGVRYSHIVDPHTGLGLTQRIAVTVAAPRATIADGLASAISVLGPEQGLALLDHFPDTAAVVMIEDESGRREHRRGELPRSPAIVVPPPAGFTALFNGADLAGWKGLVADPPARRAMTDEALAAAQTEADILMRAHWSVAEGVLVFDGAGASLVTERDFSDFELLLDWRIEAGGDSGIYLRGSPQVQIWDNPIGSGGLYNNRKVPSAPLVNADRPPGEWNTFRIVMIGDRVSVWLNGINVVDNVALENFWERAESIYPRGAIELQAHGEPLEFRHVFVREITDPAREQSTLEDDRLQWWREARFGMFIHWGLYAIPAGQWNGAPTDGPGERILHSAKIPVSEYELLRNRFDPVRFDAARWARIAAGAGMKYLVITTKHHDGFCLFDSQQTDHDIMSTPFARDIMRELVDACREEGLRIGWSHSILDWHHDDYLPRRDGDGRPADDADYERYVTYLHAQVRELLTAYGPIDIMWLDGAWDDTWTEERSRNLYGFVRRLQPDIIIHSRVSKDRDDAQITPAKFAGDLGPPQQRIPAPGLPGPDWASCMTMSGSRGYKADDDDWKSTDELVRHLIDTASKGGNLLLNVGPTAEGEIPGPSIDRLWRIGNWLSANGRSIYGTTAGPFRRLPWGRCTQRRAGERTLLYLHIFDRPDDGVLTLTSLENQVLRAFLLADPTRHLAIARTGSHIAIEVPEGPRTPPATVIVLEIEGAPLVAPFVITEGAGDRILLPAIDADVHGVTARYESGGGRNNIGFWTDAGDTVSWPVRIRAPGRFRVRLDYACAPGSGGTFHVDCGHTTLDGTIEATSSWTDFRTIDLGTATFDDSGDHTITVRPGEIVGQSLMNLRSIELRRRE